MPFHFPPPSGITDPDPGPGPGTGSHGLAGAYFQVGFGNSDIDLSDISDEVSTVMVGLSDSRTITKMPGVPADNARMLLFRFMQDGNGGHSVSFGPEASVLHGDISLTPGSWELSMLLFVGTPEGWTVWPLSAHSMTPSRQHMIDPLSGNLSLETWGVNDRAKLTLSGDTVITELPPAGWWVSAEITLVVKQDSSGGHTLELPPWVRLSSSLPPGLIDLTPEAHSCIRIVRTASEWIAT